MIWVAGPDQGYRHVNRAWLEFTGRAMEQELGDGWSESVHPQDLAARAELYAASFEARRPFRTEYRLRRHDGEYRWVLEVGVPRFDVSHVFAGFVGSVMDIEEQKRASADRDRLLSATQQALGDAEEAGRQRDEFLATVSHELRNPLNAIVGWANVLQSAELESGERERAVESILRSARAQARLVDDLLDVSRIIVGKLRLRVEVVDLNGVVEAAVESVEPAAQAKGVRIQKLLQAADPVLGDPARLQQVVLNLLNNAVKFTPVGGRVQVSTRRPNSQIELVVSDTGQGMPADFVPHVFDLFRQEDAGSRRRHGGLGLGLAIARQIVEMHAGTIRAESAGADQGSTFTVELPVALLAPPRPEGPARQQPPAEQPCAIPGVDLTGVTVLVVEDDADTRELLKLVLEDCNAVVVLCATVAEAMALLERELPTVILSDIEMPEEDGYDFIRRLRELPPEKGGNLPAAALTAYARSEDRRRSLAAGFQLHAAKPIEPAELVTIVANLAGRRTAGPVS
jgi:PAS domain S-box-containing protein